MVLGRFPGLTRAGAIAAAKTQRAAIAGGSDPAAERKLARTRVTAGEAFDSYLEHVRGTRSPDYVKDNERYPTKALAKLRGIPLDELDAATMARALDALEGKTARNLASAALCVALKHAAGRGQAGLQLIL